MKRVSIVIYLLPFLGYLGAQEHSTQKSEPPELQAIREKVAEGDAQALVNLGWAHQNGQFGLGVNLMKAVELYHRAAEKGEPMAMNNLGWIYLFHGYDKRALKRNEAEGLRWLQKAAKLEVPHAHATLAQHFCYFRNGGIRDPHSAEMYAKEAIRIGKTRKDGAYAIGMGYMVLGDIALFFDQDTKAVEHFKLSVENYKMIGSLHRLAQSYHQGKGVNKDLKKAATYAEKAVAINPKYKDCEKLLKAILSDIAAGK